VTVFNSKLVNPNTRKRRKATSKNTFLTFARTSLMIACCYAEHADDGMFHAMEKQDSMPLSDWCVDAWTRGSPRLHLVNTGDEPVNDKSITEIAVSPCKCKSNTIDTFPGMDDGRVLVKWLTVRPTVVLETNGWMLCKRTVTRPWRRIGRIAHFSAVCPDWRSSLNSASVASFQSVQLRVYHVQLYTIGLLLLHRILSNFT